MSDKHILESSDIDGVAKFIIEKAQNIIVMVGAGISVSAGIPDFRSPGTGLYSKLESYNLPYPEAVFTLDYFKKNPEAFYTLAKEIYPGLHCPTPTHYFLKLLDLKKKLLRVYTQNIDSLENIAGLDKSKIIAAHGNFDTASCIETGENVDPDKVKEYILSGPNGWKEMTEKYGGLVKPDIVFFGENLPKKFFDNIDNDFTKCDMLIVIGTSLKVNPFASLIDKVSKSTPRLLINREKVGISSNFMVSNGFKFDKDKFRDIALITDCDLGIKKLSNKLKWGKDLEDLVFNGNIKFNSENFNGISNTNTPRMYIIDGVKHYWSPKRNSFIKPKKSQKPKKTYLEYILENLTYEDTDYYTLVAKIKENWIENKVFDETYIVKSLIRGIKENKIKQIVVETEKNKYKGHIYHLI